VFEVVVQYTVAVVGVRQGCLLSPFLFIMVREICHECAIVIRIGGRIVNN